jgi:Domain of unknown function (DUF4282)
MATIPSYVDGQAIQEKGLVENLMDFSFQRMVTPRMLRMLYGLHLLLGLIVAIAFAFNGFKTTKADGLVALILSVTGMSLWVIYCRVAVELLAIIFRIGAAVTNSRE